jgi:hypothetical protein
MEISRRLVSIDSPSPNSGGGTNSVSESRIGSQCGTNSMDESLSLYPGGGDRIREREKDSSLLRTKFSESWRLEQAMVSPLSHRDVVSAISL